MEWLSPMASWSDASLVTVRDDFKRRAQEFLDANRHGDSERWARAIDGLPAIAPTRIALNRDTVGVDGMITDEQQRVLERGLRVLCPWRKGPYDLFGVHIHTEWRSDWKWRRVAPHIQPLQGRTVLDVGCGSGYHLWRMRGAGAARVLGIDPLMLFLAQFHALQRYIRDDHVDMLPLRSEDLPPSAGCFDTVFSMGVIYHRRDPLAHLDELRDALRPGGELVLETLIIDAEGETQLAPPNRYAKMRNVWSVPTPALALRWLSDAGFVEARCVDISVTSVDEQRRTDWMPFESLAEFLDPQNQTRTVEGHPAPCRGTFVARKRGGSEA